MAFKPNYNQQRNERNRAKEQKKQEKLQRREERSTQGDAEAGDPAVGAPADDDSGIAGQD